MKNILVIGGGSIGRRHINCLRAMGVPNISLVEPYDNAVKIVKEMFNDLMLFRSVGEQHRKLSHLSGQ